MKARLGALVRQAGVNYFERATLANELLQDKDWIAAALGGSDWKAVELLQAEFFHDLAGTIHLTDLIRLVQHWPDEKDWRAFGYHLGKMMKALKPAHKPRTYRRPKLKEYEALLTRVKEVEYQRNTILSERDKLLKRVAEVEKENDRLKGRVEELEGLIEKHFKRRAS
jgi:hypothetical protein